jgi:hypothetical protein
MDVSCNSPTVEYSHKPHNHLQTWATPHPLPPERSGCDTAGTLPSSQARAQPHSNNYNTVQMCINILKYSLKQMETEVKGRDGLSVTASKPVASQSSCIMSMTENFYYER